jgi:sulfur carrier protein
MKISINQIEHELPEPATLADAVTCIQAQPPFAAAVNLQFVPQSQYPHWPLQANDRIDIIAPVTGG